MSEIEEAMLTLDTLHKKYWRDTRDQELGVAVVEELKELKERLLDGRLTPDELKQWCKKYDPSEMLVRASSYFSC